MVQPHCTPFPDYFAMNDLLSEEQRLVQSTVRNFIDKEVAKKIVPAYRNENFPTEIIHGLGELGINAMT